MPGNTAAGTAVRRCGTRRRELLNERIEECCGRIGQALADLAGDGFTRVLARVEMADDVGSVGVFARLADGTHRYLGDDDTLFDRFSELRDEGGREWSQATFTLEAGGAFHLELGFEDVSDAGAGAARRDRWMERHLGPEPRVRWS